MGAGFKMLRRIIGAVGILTVMVGSMAYVVYAANGILDEYAAHQTREAREEPIAETAVSLIARRAGPPDVQPDTVDAAPGVDVEQADAEDTPTVTLETPNTPTELPPSLTPTPVPATDTVEPSPTATETSTSTQTATTPSTITPIPTNTPRTTVTLIPTNTPRPSATPTASDTPTATLTPTPSDTPIPSPTFTASPTFTPTYVIEGTYAVPLKTPVVPIPERAPVMENDPDIINFLLMGSDTSSGGIGQTDVIIIVSVNKRANSAAMWHIPRDLFVYIPNHTMDRINLAYALGAMNDYPGGGFGLMKETLLYNFGIPIDHYARVDFNDFQQIVEELGGLEVSVDCSIQDWRLKDPELDPSVEDNWEYYTMPLGRQTLTPYMALWYVRSRKTTNDMDRGRRQMDVLRAMWYQAREQGLFTQVTELWLEAAEIIDTDMTLTDVLSFVPLAVNLDVGNIARYSGSPGVHYERFLTPDDGRDVQLPKRDALLSLVKDFLTPPTDNRLGRSEITVDIVDASYWNIGFDLVAADRLAWEGYSANPLGLQQGTVRREVSVIYDYTGQQKGSALEDLKRVLRISDGQVVSEPDPNRTVDFRVELGTGYNSCVYGNAEDEIPNGPPVEEPGQNAAASASGT